MVHQFYIYTVDGRNPAPPGMSKTLLILGMFTHILPYQLVNAGFQPSTVSSNLGKLVFLNLN